MKPDSNLRTQLATLFEGGRGISVVLTLGLLIGLMIMGGSVLVRRLVMTEDEYSAPDHFSGLEVHAAPPEAVVETTTSVKTNAILMSVLRDALRK